MSSIAFSVVTKTTFYGGTFFLLGTDAPVDGVFIDGVRVEFITTSAVPPAADLGKGTSVIVPLPESVMVGEHQLRVTRGGAEWRSGVSVVRAPVPRRAEVGTGCSRCPDCTYEFGRTPGTGVSLEHVVQNGRGWHVQSDAPVGILVRDADALRALPVEIYMGPPEGRVIEAIYADGSLGERWALTECGVGKSPPLPGGPGVPLWETLESPLAPPAEGQ